MRRAVSLLLAIVAMLVPAASAIAAPMRDAARVELGAENRVKAILPSGVVEAEGHTLFLQRDPNGYQDSVNQYAYGANDPINHRDPTGEFGEPGERAFGAAVGLGMSDWTAEKLYEAEIYRCQMLWGVSRETCESIPSDVAQGVALGSALKEMTPADIQNAFAAHVDAVKSVLGAAGLKSVASIVPIVPRARTSGGQAWRDLLGSVLDEEPPAPAAQSLVVQPRSQLLPDEGEVGTYRELTRAGAAFDDITAHHIPSNAHMSKQGVAKSDGISINMEQPSSGGRHRKTFTYGTQADVDMSSRDALAAGVRDARRIYQEEGLYTPKIRGALRELIGKNKATFPGIFRKRGR